ncbi:MAG: hypothetical protein ACREJB_04390, partial [Planctomycetaceae bacterium]
MKRFQRTHAGRSLANCLWMSLFLAASLPATASAFQPPDAEPPQGVGLQGLLPEVVPDGLTIDDFAGIAESWVQWGEEVGELLLELYESEEPLSLERQRTILTTLQDKLGVIQLALADPAYAEIHDDLVSLEGRLRRRLDLMTATLDVLQTAPEDQTPALRAALGDLINAVEDYEETGGIGGAGRIREALAALREINVEAGARIAAVIEPYYFNFNFELIATE